MRLKNPRAKGNRIRLLVIRKLESDGWLVDIVEKTGRFVKVKDLFGLWDLIAIKKAEHTIIKLIQVKTGKPKLDIFKNFAYKYMDNNILFEIWIKKDRKDFEIIKL